MLTRSGEAPAIGWSRNMLYSGFDILPRSVFRRQTGFAARITRTLSRSYTSLHAAHKRQMPNPYKSPSSALTSNGKFSVARRKLAIGIVCLGIAALFCTATGVFGAYSWYGSRGDEIKSALHSLLPILVAIQILALSSIGMSIYGLLNKRIWSINLSITCLAICGLSVLLPISAFGIWALIDSRVKQYFRHENAG